jgi:hypothetical protein
MFLRARPLYRDVDAAVTTSGVSFQVQTSASYPVKIHQVALWVDGLAFVGIGKSPTPPAPVQTNSVYQEANSERIYTLDGNDAYEGYIYVYAASGTISCRFSRFG